MNRNKFFRSSFRNLFAVVLPAVLASFQYACSTIVLVSEGEDSIEDIAVAVADVAIQQSLNIQDLDAKLLQELSAEVGEHLDSFRTELLNWEYSNRKMDDTLRQRLSEIIREANWKSVGLDQLDPQRARASFYSSYWKDFQERIIEGRSECRMVSSLYGETLERYKEIYKDDASNVSHEEAFILIELAHQLINRDSNLYEAF
mgnify:CR=1 FL=1